jgi:hypothetical protein
MQRRANHGEQSNNHRRAIKFIEDIGNFITGKDYTDATSQKRF